MATHTMHLHPQPFEQIRNGTKTVELRINDEKRRQLQVGDTITFISRSDPDDTISVHITNVESFVSFEELYKSIPPESFGVKEGDSFESLYEYYSREEEEKYGVVAISFALAE